MIKATKLVLLPLLLGVAGCADLVGEQKPPLTPLQVQSIQKRDFETNKDVAFASTVSVLQDLGYTVNSADKDSGFITGQSLANASEDAGLIDLLLDDIDTEYDTVTVQTKATAFVEQITDNRTSIRLSFVTSRNRSGALGQNSTQDQQILDQKLYQNAFERIENAVFIRTGNSS